MIRTLTLLAVVLATPVLADTPARIEAAFRDWAAHNGADRALISIAHKGQPVRDVAIGDITPQTPIETASLSKAITAVCAATLIEEGLWRPETTSAEVLGFGVEGISLAQLLTHTSGLGPDETQKNMPMWLDRQITRAQIVSEAALTRADQNGQAGQYAYNNENYAIIGAMIEVETGQPYEKACVTRVMLPAGIFTSASSPRTRAFTAWGGWEMRAGEYNKFMWHAYGPDGIIGRHPARWPAADLGGGMQYGMGMFQRAMRDSHNFWHFGALCFPGRLDVGSYAVIWLAEYSVVAAYDICPSWDQMGALDAVLVAAVFE